MKIKQKVHLSQCPVLGDHFSILRVHPSWLVAKVKTEYSTILGEYVIEKKVNFFRGEMQRVVKMIFCRRLDIGTKGLSADGTFICCVGVLTNSLGFSTEQRESTISQFYNSNLAWIEIRK